MEKRNNSPLRRLLALLLFVAMLVPQILVPGLFPDASAAEWVEEFGSNSGKTVTVLAGSDFQLAYDYDAVGEQVRTHIAAVKAAGFTSIDGFLFAGDYSQRFTSTDTTSGVTALKKVISEEYPNLSEDRKVWVQGNHDPDDLTADGTLSTSGAHDTADYGVYTLNHKDYMWYSGMNETTVKQTATNLSAYLNAKCQAGYTKPIFVVSHVPLHYSMRTNKYGDGMYGNYIFDVLNRAGENGLNIIFLFGHDHSNAWDDYIGGSAVYLAKGDSILIAQASRTNYAEEKLNFTYMNAGYVGYYSSDSTGAEKDLTMSVFQITGNEVKISRYTASGLHDLKSKGVKGTRAISGVATEDIFEPNTAVYTSPQTVKLNQSVISALTGIAVEGPDGMEATVYGGNAQIPTGYSAYQSYEIAATGYTDGDTFTVTIPADSSFDAACPVAIIDHKTGKSVPTTIVDGNIIFTTDHLGVYSVAQAGEVTDAVEGKVERFLQPVTSLTEGVPYVITHKRYGYVLTGTAQNKGNHTGLLLSGQAEDATDFWYVVDGYLVYGSATGGKYLLIDYKDINKNGNVILGSTSQGTPAYTRWSNTNQGFEILSYNTSMDTALDADQKLYLNQHGGTASDICATAYSGVGGCYWTIYGYAANVKTTMSVAASQSTISTDNTALLAPVIKVNGNLISDYEVIWTSSDESYATVSADGVVTPKKAGQVYITATLKSVQGISMSTPIVVSTPIIIVNSFKYDTQAYTYTTYGAQLNGSNPMDASSTTPSGPYVIVEYYSNWILTGNQLLTTSEGYNGAEGKDGLEMLSYLPPYDIPYWYFDGTGLCYSDHADTSKYLISDGTKVLVGAATGSNKIYTVRNGAYGATNSWNIYDIAASDGSDEHLRFRGGRPYNVSSKSSNKSFWKFYSVTPARKVELMVDPIDSVLKVGNTVTLTPIVKVANSSTTRYNINWTSSDVSVATVDAKGVVTTVGSGTAIITATLTSAKDVALSVPMTAEVKIQVPRASVNSNGIGHFTIPAMLERTTELVDGTPYIITSAVSENTEWVLTNVVQPSNHNSSYSGLALEHIDVVGLDHIWYYDEQVVDGVTKQYLRYGNMEDTDNYMTIIDNTLNIGAADEYAFATITPNSAGSTRFQISTNGLDKAYYLNQYGGRGRDTVVATSSYSDGRFYFNKIVPEQQVTLSIEPGSINFYPTHTEPVKAKLVVDGVEVTDYVIKWASLDHEIASVYQGTVTGQKAGSTVITATITKIKGEELPEPLTVGIPVTVQDISKIVLSDTTAEVAQQASSKASVLEDLDAETRTPIYMTVHYVDGNTDVVPVTVNMLTQKDGSRFSTYNAGEFTELAVNYGGYSFCVDNFSVNVIAPNQPQYPAYPEEGSVTVNKKGLGINFPSTGTAKIELSAAGVPVKTGADVIIMLDTSTSMGNDIGKNEGITTGVKRIDVLTESLHNLLDTLSAKNADGQELDVRVAIADFNTYFEDFEDSVYYNDPDDTVLNGFSQYRSGTYYGGPFVYTGTGEIDASAFVDVHTLGKKDANGNIANPFTRADANGNIALVQQYGTNYDYAFDVIYELGAAITEKNATPTEEHPNGENRDLFVIFMSDGEPLSYNYFSAWSGATTDNGYNYWNEWLLGRMTDGTDGTLDMFSTGSNKSYYYGPGYDDGIITNGLGVNKHWMAEAIKGNPAKDYDVIRKNDERDINADNWIKVPGLGATMYSIGFCLTEPAKLPDGSDNPEMVSLEAMSTAIQGIASSDEFFFAADDADQLDNAFSRISEEILYAASDGHFVDTMGVDYELQMAKRNYIDSNGAAQTITPMIDVTTYSLYTYQEYQDGLCSAAQVGTRKPVTEVPPTVLETVTFSDDGTKAYSNVLGDADIMKNGVICANTFWYNTNSTAVSITLENGSTYSLPAETFYWKLGTISTREQVLSYYVYLTDSLNEDGDDNGKGAGVYDTNESATLYYTNYLGDPCELDVPSPSFPWAKSTVGYGFYLVNKNGEPIVNKNTGKVGSFQQSVKLDNVVYRDFEWNVDANDNTAQEVIASQLMTKLIAAGYKLYDSGASYQVSLNSNGLGYYNVGSNGTSGQSTYITGITDTPVLGSAGTQVNTTDYATTATVVWFAVMVNEGALVVNKTVAKNGDNYKLTLDVFANGATTQISTVKPADIVLVLDQSASMYTPVGHSADRLYANKKHASYVAPPASAKISDFATKVTTDATMLENAKHLGYYIAVHNSGNYMYIVQYAQYAGQSTTDTADDKWGWFYVPVEESSTPVKVDTTNTTPNTDTALANGMTYAQYNSSGVMTAAILPDSLVTYYKTQYGALYESVNAFVSNLSQQAQENDVNHRLAIVGFSSPYYDCWDNYQGTGIYINGQYHLYDTDYMYKSSSGTILDPDQGHAGNTFVEVAANASEYAYTGITDDTYQNAFVDISNAGGLNSVQASIDAIQTNYMQTCPAIGLRIARSIFLGKEIKLTEPANARKEFATVSAEEWIGAAKLPEGESLTDMDRDQIIILFTDGVPTVSMYSNHEDAMSENAEFRNELWNGNAGMRDAINEANVAKEESIAIYTIGTTGASKNPGNLGEAKDKGNTVSFLDLVSSNYPYSNSAYDVITKSGDNTAIDSHNFYVNYGTPAPELLYNVAASTDSGENRLTIAFETIMESVTTPSVKLNGDDILREILSDYFDLIGNDKDEILSGIKVYTAAFNRDGTVQTPVLRNDLTVTLGMTDSDSKRYDIIEVTGYQYYEEYYSESPRTVNGADYHGSKLILEVPVQVRKGFWGGNNVPTNDSSTAIYDTYIENGLKVEDMVVPFPMPQVNVPTAEIDVKDVTVYYGDQNLTHNDLLGKVTVDGFEVVIDADGNFSPAKGNEWMADYADLKWGDNSAILGSDPSSTTPGKYTYSVVYTPSDDGKQKEGDEYSNIVGTAISTDGVALTADGQVYVLVPTVTYQDSAIDGIIPDQKYFEDNNLVKDVEGSSTLNPGVVWTITSADSNTEIVNLIGTEPKLTFTYAPSWAFTGSRRNLQHYKYDTQIEVTVTSSNGGENITNVVTFKWVDCDDNLHTDYSQYATIPTHLGSTNDFEFWIHVNSTSYTVEDIVVIDYGLNVDIDLVANDVFKTAGIAQLAGIFNEKPTSIPESFDDANTASGQFGVLQMNYTNGAANGSVRYKLGSLGMQMNAIEVFHYMVEYGDGVYYFGTVTIIPATILYFEDQNYQPDGAADANAPFITYKNTWNPVSDGATNHQFLQGSDRPGEDVQNALGDLDMDNVYGYDAAYSKSTQYSLGMAMMTTVSAEGQQSASAEFTFWGTGFDIVSLCSNKTGAIMVTIKRLDKTEDDRYLMVDTYYSYSYGKHTVETTDAEGNVTTEEVIGWYISGQDVDNATYQVPVMRVDDLAYGQYWVEIFVGYEQYIFDHGQYGGGKYDFYLDAIRIYNPANNGAVIQKDSNGNPVKDSSGNLVLNADSTIQNAYNEDGEYAPVIEELRNLILDSAKADASKVTGVLFIDRFGSASTVADYKAYGPNNELYLDKDQSISFAITNSASLAKVQLAMKALGDEVKVRITNTADANEKKELTITSSTDLYYDLSNFIGDTIVIQNVSDSKGALLSITNKKVTYKLDTGAAAMDGGDFVVDGDTANNALMLLNGTLANPEISTTGASLSFEDEVKYNVYYTVGDPADIVEMGLILFGQRLEDGTISNADMVIPGYVTNGTEYMVSTNGIPAKQMGDVIYFKVYAKLSDGSFAYSDVAGYSAATYAKNILAKEDASAESKALVVALMNYGTEAQKYFGYKTEALMNSFLTAEQQALVAAYDASSIASPYAADSSKVGAFTATEGFSGFGTSVSFEGAFAINYYVTPAAEATVTMYYWKQADYEAAEVLTAENATGTMTMTGAGEVFAAVSGIAAKEMEDTVFVAMVYEVDDVTYSTGVRAYSLAAYCKNIAAKEDSAMQALAQATAIYGSYAKAYFA